MRFHVVALPHTQTTGAYSSCAYTNKIINFCKMMISLGHTVFLYAGEQNEAPCTELITCISETERAKVVGDGFYTSASFDETMPHWVRFNLTVAAEINSRAEKQDFVCIVGGTANQLLAEKVRKDLMVVEFGVGYSGTFSQFRVFESYSWMHMHYGREFASSLGAAQGKWYDTVIPGYYDPADFSMENGDPTADYYLFLGRLTSLKGYQIAADTCERAGKRLILAGNGTPPTYGEYVGSVGPEERNKLLLNATALIAPTQYIEPFGNVSVEAQAVGTPVITTDWGAFTENVEHGKTGFRCRTLAEFVTALDDVKALDPLYIEQRAKRNYSIYEVRYKYEQYFERLLGLWNGGWSA